MATSSEQTSSSRLYGTQSSDASVSSKTGQQGPVPLERPEPITINAFKDLSFDLVDSLWPETQYPHITLPDGRKIRRATLRQSASLMSGETVTIIVGKTGTKFIVAQNLLFHHSRYFRAAFTSGFMESETRTLRMPDVDSDLFHFLLEYLVLGSFRSGKYEIDRHARPRRPSGEDFIDERCNLWPWAHLMVLADFLDIASAKEAAEKVIAQRVKSDTEARRSFPDYRRKGAASFSPTFCQYAYENLQEESGGLYTLVINHMADAIHQDQEWIGTYRDFLVQNPDLLVEWACDVQNDRPMEALNGPFQLGRGKQGYNGLNLDIKSRRARDLEIDRDYVPPEASGNVIEAGTQSLTHQ